MNDVIIALEKIQSLDNGVTRQHILNMIEETYIETTVKQINRGINKKALDVSFLHARKNINGSWVFFAYRSENVLLNLEEGLTIEEKLGVLMDNEERIQQEASLHFATVEKKKQSISQAIKVSNNQIMKKLNLGKDCLLDFNYQATSKQDNGVYEFTIRNKGVPLFQEKIDVIKYEIENPMDWYEKTIREITDKIKKQQELAKRKKMEEFMVFSCRWYYPYRLYLKQGSLEDGKVFDLEKKLVDENFDFSNVKRNQILIEEIQAEINKKEALVYQMEEEMLEKNLVMVNLSDRFYFYLEKEHKDEHHNFRMYQSSGTLNKKTFHIFCNGVKIKKCYSIAKALNKMGIKKS
jgi:hypothetical protein